MISAMTIRIWGCMLRLHVDFMSIQHHPKVTPHKGQNSCQHVAVELLVLLGLVFNQCGDSVPQVFLNQRELNEVYQGGVGSYALIIMTTAFLQRHASRQPSNNSSSGARSQSSGSRKRARQQSTAAALDCNLGLLLVDFLR